MKSGLFMFCGSLKGDAADGNKVFVGFQAAYMERWRLADVLAIAFVFASTAFWRRAVVAPYVKRKAA